MRGIIIKDDYIGFTYAGKHSSQFGIFSVSSGDRYMRTLSPEFSDSVTNVNGRDETYYFGTTYNRRSFQLHCAFDSVTEQEYREMRLWLRTDTISPFTFDEIPYIQFFAKVASPPQFSFITFEDEYGDRIYKGEIQASFTCYDGYGYSVSKWLNEYTDAAPQDGNDIYLMASNVEEWAQSSRLQPRRKYANYSFDTYTSQKMQVYNGGDLPAHFILEIDITGKPVKELKLKLEDKYITIDLSKLPDGILKIDTKKRLVTLIYQGDEGEVTEIINDYITAGDFFLIPVSEKITDVKLLDFGTSNFASVNIDYRYRYL